MLGEMGLERLRQMEAAASLKRYQIIADNTRDIILFLRLDDGRIIEANAGAVLTYGYTHEELLSMRVHDLRVPEERDGVTFHLAEADKGGVLFETFHCRKDGTLLPVEVSSRGETIDGVRMVVSVVRDITERKEAVRALRESEQRWATTLSSIGDAVIATDNAGGITFMNMSPKD